jgi:hypothetical protein
VTHANNPELVHVVIRRLNAEGLLCLLFGGWAEEALGLVPPRRHRDIDLLLVAPSFDRLDRLLTGTALDLEEIVAKRYAHKRAFVLEGVLVEVTLVEDTPEGPQTTFWGDVPFAWTEPLAEPCYLESFALAAASRANLRRYRMNHNSIEPRRWANARSG